jgi:hypothetical protein
LNSSWVSTLPNRAADVEADVAAEVGEERHVYPALLVLVHLLQHVLEGKRGKGGRAKREKEGGKRGKRGKRKEG